jgi:DNA-binding protein HU-beta
MAKDKAPMTKSQLVNHLAEAAEISKAQAKAALDALADTAYKEAKAKKEKGFTIPGIGKLVVVRRKARTGRNPQTGEKIRIPAKTALKFRISKACKDAVLGAK